MTEPMAPLKSSELARVRLGALQEANITVERTVDGQQAASDGLVIQVAQRYEHYVLTGELKTLPGAEMPPGEG